MKRRKKRRHSDDLAASVNGSSTADVAWSGTSDVCASTKGLKIPYHNKADGFTAALILTLNQIKFCELHSCQPRVEWGPFPACKYAGVRFPGRTPFFDAGHGRNAFEYFFKPICGGRPAAQLAPPMLSCEQREKIHRVFKWAVRTYYYGVGSGPRGATANDTYDEAWYAAQRREGSRLVHSYLRLQPHVTSRLTSLSQELLGEEPHWDSSTARRGARVGWRAHPSLGSDTVMTRAKGKGKGKSKGKSMAAAMVPSSSRPGAVLGVHLRGTDKGKYLSTAGSGRAIGPSVYEPYVRAFLDAHGPNATVFVATDSPSFLAEVLAKWPSGRLRYRADVLRHEANVAFAGGSVARGPDANYRKGEEVLLDSLLLSQCDFLLHAASGVAELAMYWNERLHTQSVHLQYEHGRQQPHWMPRRTS